MHLYLNQNMLHACLDYAIHVYETHIILLIFSFLFFFFVGKSYELQLLLLLKSRIWLYVSLQEYIQDSIPCLDYNIIPVESLNG